MKNKQSTEQCFAVWKSSVWSFWFSFLLCSVCAGSSLVAEGVPESTFWRSRNSFCLVASSYIKHQENGKQATCNNCKMCNQRVIKSAWEYRKATDEHQKHRGVNIRVLSSVLSGPIPPTPFPSFFPPPSPSGGVPSPTLFPLLTFSWIPPLFWLEENSDLGTPMI